MCQTWVNHSKEIGQTELRSRARFNCMLLENFRNMSLECSQEPRSFQECRATSPVISLLLPFFRECLGGGRDSSIFFFLLVIKKHRLADGVKKIYSLEIAIYKQVKNSENNFYVIFSSSVALENGHLLSSHTYLSYLYVLF